MSLYEHLAERAAKSQIACKNCHAIADITLHGPSVLLVCPQCRRILGQWETSPQCIADMTTFVAGAKSD
jgi:hypothetical protein